MTSPRAAAAILNFAQVKEPTTYPASNVADTVAVAWPSAAALTDAASTAEGAADAAPAKPADNVANVKLAPRFSRRSRSFSNARPVRIFAAASLVPMATATSAKLRFSMKRIKMASRSLRLRTSNASKTSGVSSVREAMPSSAEQSVNCATAASFSWRARRSSSRNSLPAAKRVAR